MKELMLRYEFDLNKLKMNTGLKCVELDHRLHVVTIIGDSKTVEQCISQRMGKLLFFTADLN
jgi:hypothetical protein